MRRPSVWRWVLSAAAAALLMGAAGRAEASNVAFAENDSCADCHEKQWKEFETTSHGFKGDKRTPAGKKGCQSCHGPAGAHVDSMGKVPVLNLGPKSSLKPQQRSAVCLNCHDKTAKLANWHGSMHDMRGKSCSDCHNVHGGNDKNLRAATVTDTCLGCHKEIKSELGRSSHHPIREGRMDCTSCHNPHGTGTDKMITANTVNEKCWSCHAEHRGPFLWDHGPVRENCLTCHKPHGSSHERLLVGDKPQLCSRCHSISRHPGTMRAFAQDPVSGVSEAGQSPYFANLNNVNNAAGAVRHSVGVQGWYRGCTNCHSTIHGSNHPSGKMFLR